MKQQCVVSIYCLFTIYNNKAVIITDKARQQFDGVELSYQTRKYVTGTDIHQVDGK